MPNGDILTEQDWKAASQEQKELWTFRMLRNLNDDVAKLKKWATLRIFGGSMVGGALMILILVLLGVKVL
jgi:hypothetical protein